jgi:hypothetical protein
MTATLPPRTPIDPSACAAIPGWFQPPQGLAQLVERFGRIEVAGGRVTTPGWEDAHMILVHADWLPRGNLYVNKQVWPALASAFEACLALHDGYKIRTLGCFAPRPKRVNGDLSTHSWGIAVDLNPDTNPLSLDGTLRMDIPPSWIAEFEKRGFTSGARFPRPDAMHLQFSTNY